MKVNRKLLKIGVVSLVIAVAITVFVYREMALIAQPEETKRVPVFERNIQEGKAIRPGDISHKQIPVSLIPGGVIIDTSAAHGKILVDSVNEGEFIFLHRLTERGLIEKGNETFWEIGIEVSLLSNFLGAQIKEGEQYFLLYTPAETTKRVILNKVIISSLVDSTGKRIIADEGIVRTLNVLVPSKEEVLEIASAKLISDFELVRAPEGWE